MVILPFMVISNICCKRFLQNRPGQFGFYSLYVFERMCRLKGFHFLRNQILGAINETKSFPYVTILGFLLRNSFLSLS